MSFYFSPKIVTDGLVLYLDAANPNSYPGSGTIWTDLTSNGNNGSLINGPTFSNTNIGNIVFDGVNDHITTEYNVALTNFTVGVWFKPTDSTNPTSARLIDKSFTAGFWLGKNAQTGQSNSWGGGVRESSSPFGRYLTLPDTQWNFLVSVRSGTTHILYGNGIDNTTSGTVSSMALNTSNITIAIPNNLNASQCFKGSISNIQLYNRALSAVEVAQNYNALKGRFGL